MKYKYISKSPGDFKGKKIKEGDIVDSEIELSKTQFEEIKEKVETPKKNKRDKK